MKSVGSGKLAVGLKQGHNRQDYRIDMIYYQYLSAKSDLDIQVNPVILSKKTANKTRNAAIREICVENFIN